MRDSGEEEENQECLLVREGGRSRCDSSPAMGWGGDSSVMGQKRGPGSLSLMRERSGGGVVAISCMGND